MDKDKDDDTEDNVWNASGVILDIDSGALIPTCSFSSQCSFIIFGMMHLLRKRFSSCTDQSNTEKVEQDFSKDAN